MDLFDQGMQQIIEKEQPLAARMRPVTLEQYIGQEHIVGKGRLLYRAIQADQLSSLIFYGPPGTGKTSLAAVIANTTKSHFITINAVLAGVSDIRRAVDDAQKRRKFHEARTILFVDEVHRWNKAQQDALLPWVENGTIVLIGATIENPYFEVNKALVSRSRIFQLTPLTKNELYAIAKEALSDKTRGYGRYSVDITQEALDHLVNIANGDARSLLNAVELAVETTPDRFPPSAGAPIRVDLAVAEESIQRKVVLYDKEGDYHFDTISAFIKSLRGSDPDAVLYWLAKMVYAGEDPRYIFRRMLIFASEDIGLADPTALIEAEAAAAAFDRVGMPEGRFHLAHAALYLATAPKSNSVISFFDALDTIEKEQESGMPKHLKSAARDAEAFGHGEGYLYPHSYREHWVAQQYLPASLQGKIFYRPGSIGYEGTLKERVEKRRESQLALMFESTEEPSEILTFSPAGKNRDRWLARASGAVGGHLAELRDRVFEGLSFQRHFVALDLNVGSGLLTWELLRRCPEGGVFCLSRDDAPVLRGKIDALPDLEQPRLLQGEVDQLAELLKTEGYAGVKFDLITGRNALAKFAMRKAIATLLFRLTKEGGTLSLVETAPRWGQRLTELVDPARLDAAILIRLKEVEETLYLDPLDFAVNWTEADIESILSAAGYHRIELSREDFALERRIDAADLARWLDGGKLNAKISESFKPNEVKVINKVLKEELVNKSVQWRKPLFFIRAQKPG
jgi:putative ATPase